jgi:hypothetical protein
LWPGRNGAQGQSAHQREKSTTQLHGKISLIWIVAHELLPPRELFFLLKPDGALERNQSKCALAFSCEKWLFLGEKATQLTCFRGTSTLVPLYCAHTGAWRLVR